LEVVRLFRDVGTVTMDVNGVEQVNVAALGGAEQREADEYNRVMGAMLSVVRQVNGPAAPSIKSLFLNAIPVGKMEDAATSGKVWRIKQLDDAS
jgi:hypothetical protein